MSARSYWNDRADGRNVCGKGSTPVHLLPPLRVWKRLLAAGMLFCLGAQAAEKRNLDDIRNALWQDSDDVSLREMLAALGEAGEKNLSVTFAGVFCETCRRADADALEVSSGFSKRYPRSLTGRGSFSPRLLTPGCE